MYNNEYKSINNLLSLIMSISNTDKYYDDFMLFDEKLMGYSVSLVMEIDELLEKEYQKEEIAEIINNTNFLETDPTLNQEEAEYLKKYALKILNIRYNLYLEEKDKKIKKHLFNK